MVLRRGGRRCPILDRRLVEGKMTRRQAGEERSDDRVLDQAIASAKAGHLPDAERRFREFLRQHPSHARALSQFGILLAQTGRLEEAESHIRQAIDLGAVSGGIFYNHGTILKHLRRPLEALDAYNRALAVDRTNPETWNNRGTVFNDLARYGEAISDFEQALLRGGHLQQGQVAPARRAPGRSALRLR
jgi:Flp pilus assembly protein TadD